MPRSVGWSSFFSEIAPLKLVEQFCGSSAEAVSEPSASLIARSLSDVGRKTSSPLGTGIPQFSRLTSPPHCICVYLLSCGAGEALMRPFSSLNPLFCANAVVPVSTTAIAAAAEKICFFVISPHKKIAFCLLNEYSASRTSPFLHSLISIGSIFLYSSSCFAYAGSSSSRFPALSVL